MSSVFVTLPLPSPGIDMLRERFDVTMMEAEGMPPETLKGHLSETDPIGIVGMVNVPITDDIMSAAPHLRVIANYAVGYNNVDVAAATRRGVLVTNTPWIATGHLNDITVAKPIFRQGRIVAFAASTAHAPDIGGKVRSVEPREVFEEGFHIPVMKLLNAGKPDATLIKLLRAAVRTPVWIMLHSGEPEAAMTRSGTMGASAPNTAKGR